MTHTEKRLKELQKKKTLTNDEMAELVNLSPKGSFKLLPNAFSIGTTNLDKSIKNIEESKRRSKEAFEKGFYLEVISLRLQQTDLWLRTYWVAKNKKREIFSSDDKRTFGILLNDCNRLGFNNKLYKKLKRFNDIRVEGIHKFLLGERDYDSLKFICEETHGIIEEISKYVANEIGIPLN